MSHITIMSFTIQLTVVFIDGLLLKLPRRFSMFVEQTESSPKAKTRQLNPLSKITPTHFSLWNRDLSKNYEKSSAHPLRPSRIGGPLYRPKRKHPKLLLLKRPLCCLFSEKRQKIISVRECGFPRKNPKTRVGGGKGDVLWGHFDGECENDRKI